MQLSPSGHLLLLLLHLASSLAGQALLYRCYPFNFHGGVQTSSLKSPIPGKHGPRTQLTLACLKSGCLNPLFLKTFAVDSIDLHHDSILLPDHAFYSIIQSCHTSRPWQTL